MSHSPFTRVCHCIPRGYTCPFFSTATVVIVRIDLFYICIILYSPWIQLQRCHCIVKYYIQKNRLSKSVLVYTRISTVSKPLTADTCSYTSAWCRDKVTCAWEDQLHSESRVTVIESKVTTFTKGSCRSGTLQLDGSLLVHVKHYQTFTYFKSIFVFTYYIVYNKLADPNRRSCPVQ